MTRTTMAQLDLKAIKKLRDETSASIADCRRALEEANGDEKKALAWLKKRASEIAAKKADRDTSEGLIEAYIHGGGKVGVMVELLCETDFVAKTDEYKHLAKEVAMQIAAMNPEDVDSLLKQEYIRDGSQTIDQLVKAMIGKLGENITVKRFVRFEIEYLWILSLKKRSNECKKCSMSSKRTSILSALAVPPLHLSKISLSWHTADQPN